MASISPFQGEGPCSTRGCRMNDNILKHIEKALEIHKKSPYGDIWQEFTLEELLAYALVKVKRARWIDIDFLDKKYDDIYDGINILLFCLMKMDGIKDGQQGNEEKTKEREIQI